MLTCDICNCKLVSAKSVVHHMNIHFYRKQFSCTKCKTVFTSQLDLRKHNEQVHSAASDYRCDTCNFKTLQYKILECHVLGHYNVETEKGIICNICKQEFGTEFQLKKHLRLHINVPDYYCKSCDKRFTTQAEVKKHNRTTHSTKYSHITSFETGYVQCTKCNGIFFSSAQLELHRCSKVLAERLQCSVCNKQLKSIYNLRLHLNIHTGEKPYKCATCKNRFSDPGALSGHLLLHSEARKFICQTCGATYKQRQGLRTHMKNHRISKGKWIGAGNNDGKNRCKICGLFFSDMGTHMRTHSEERPYTCDTCGKSFAQSGTLTNHARTHLAINYPCKYCFKVLKHPSSLRLHERQHTRKNMSKCDVCGTEFTRKSTLILHMETHSKEKHVCHICGKSLKSTSMYAHLKSHDPKNTFWCKVCETVLKSKQSFVQHMNTHDDSSYICGYPDCNKGYASKKDLLKHVRKTHSDVSCT